MRPKTFALLMLLGFICLSFGTARAADETVVASNYSDRYHIPSCKIASKIPKEELLIFKSPVEAEATGLLPCKKCHPSAVANNLHAARSRAKSLSQN